MTDRRTTAFADATESDVRAAFDAEDYVADDDVVTTVLLALRLGKPLLVEGEPGAGKTELAKVLAAGFDTDLVRLQCYEGLTAESALYEWNYTKQLLAVQRGNRHSSGGGSDGGGSGSDGNGDGSDGSDAGAEDGERGESVFTEEYLLERPLLRALRNDGETPPVLLIDEVDRADEEFEALLLEVLSDFQVSVPELGTVRAETPPVVVVTSNRTRGLSDALKRRCLYLHVSPPSFEKERAILARKVPELDGAVAAELCAAAGRLREEPLRKPPGAAETIDWARAVAALRTNGDESLSSAEVEQTLGCLLKEVEDVERVDDDLLADLLDAASEARASTDAAR
ncbi:AAA family ATPase [Halobacterium zhouii]|uniref:AAA family ATPase n=1 Tax=Halobacterium zhouii TaxID=2902624 RepID=UPI001E4955AD|nr:MoxR family ATPase [Halobacterium zhouii]